MLWYILVEKYGNYYYYFIIAYYSLLGVRFATLSLLLNKYQ